MADTKYDDVINEYLDALNARLAIDRKKAESMRWIEYGFGVFSLVWLVLFVWYVFWDGGFQFFWPPMHDIMVNLALNIPGPHQEPLRVDVAEDGYVSIVALHEYITIASEHAKGLAETK